MANPGLSTAEVNELQSKYGRNVLPYKKDFSLVILFISQFTNPLILVLFVAAMAFLQGKVEWSPMANILFVVVGFAGGLTGAKASDG